MKDFADPCVVSRKEEASMSVMVRGFSAVFIDDLAAYMSENEAAAQVGTGVSLDLLYEASHTVCAWCGRSRSADGLWEESATERGNNTTHGICPECLASEMGKDEDSE